MRDITKIMNRYRECIRNLWNIYFLEQTSQGDDWDRYDKYEEICGLLFSALVLKFVDRLSCKKSLAYELIKEPILFFRVVPCAESGVPIYINRDVPCTGYWDYPLNIIKPSDVDMRFVDFFDFNLKGFRDFQYCRVRIVGSNTYSEIIGRDALLESNNVKIIFDEEWLPDGLSAPKIQREN